MAAGDLVVADGQAELNGLLLGSTNYAITDWNMLGDPEARVSSTMRADRGQMDHGYGDGGRELFIEVTCRGTGSTIQTNRDNLAVAWRRTNVDDQALYFRASGTKYLYIGRALGADTSAGVYLPTRCEFVATWPDRLSAAESSQAITSSAPASTISNAGTVDGIWRWEVTGPCTGPYLRNMADPTVQYIGFPGLVVPSGDTLVVSYRRGRALLDGVDVSGKAREVTGAHMPSLGGEGFRLSPGTNDIRWNSTSGGGTSVFYWRSAWQ